MLQIVVPLVCNLFICDLLPWYYTLKSKIHKAGQQGRQKYAMTSQRITFWNKPRLSLVYHDTNMSTKANIFKEIPFQWSKIIIKCPKHIFFVHIAEDEAFAKLFVR